MDYRYLSVFIEVAKRLNFTLAGKALGITPAAVSRQIKLFENSVNRQLFLRSPQKVSLTKDGESLFKLALSFQENCKKLLSEELVGEIRLGVITPVLSEKFLNFIKNRISNSKLNIKIVSTSPSNLTALLEEGKIDIAIFNKNIQSEMLTSRKIYKETPCLISNRKIAISEIEKFNWITCEDKDYIFNYAFLKKIKNRAKVVQVNSPSFQVKLVEKGIGVAIVSRSLLSKNNKIYKIPVKEFRNEWFYLTMPNHEFLSPVIQFMIDEILNYQWEEDH